VKVILQSKDGQKYEYKTYLIDTYEILTEAQEIISTKAWDHYEYKVIQIGNDLI
jgi:hypothetical protein